MLHACTTAHAAQRRREKKRQRSTAGALHGSNKRRRSAALRTTALEHRAGPRRGRQQTDRQTADAAIAAARSQRPRPRTPAPPRRCRNATAHACGSKHARGGAGGCAARQTAAGDQPKAPPVAPLVRACALLLQSAALRRRGRADAPRSRRRRERAQRSAPCPLPPCWRRAPPAAQRTPRGLSTRRSTAASGQPALIRSAAQHSGGERSSVSAARPARVHLAHTSRDAVQRGAARCSAPHSCLTAPCRHAHAAQRGRRGSRQKQTAADAAID
jgi:hypothetical protein